MATQAFRVPHGLVEAALAEGARRGEAFIAPEHLLVAAAGAAPLTARGVGGDALRAAVDRALGPGTPLPGPGLAAMPTSHAGRALQRAAWLAEARGGGPAAASDLLLALLDEYDDQTVAAAVLRAAGVDPAAVRAELEAAAAAGPAA